MTKCQSVLQCNKIVAFCDFLEMHSIYFVQSSAQKQKTQLQRANMRKRDIQSMHFVTRNISYTYMYLHPICTYHDQLNVTNFGPCVYQYKCLCGGVGTSVKYPMVSNPALSGYAKYFAVALLRVSWSCFHRMWAFHSTNTQGQILKDAGTNSIFSRGCYRLVHKRCTGISGTLKAW